MTTEVTAFKFKPLFGTSATWYSDPTDSVVGNDLSRVTGNVDGFSMKLYMRDTFFKEYFFYRIGCSGDISIPKTIIDGSIEYKMAQRRAEIPLTMGASLWTKNSRFYLGFGFSYNFYELSFKINRGADQIFKADGLARVVYLGLLFDLTPKIKFHTELIFLESAIKGENEFVNVESVDLVINPRYTRVYIGILYNFWE